MESVRSHADRQNRLTRHFQLFIHRQDGREIKTVLTNVSERGCRLAPEEPFWSTSASGSKSRALEALQPPFAGAPRDMPERNSSPTARFGKKQEKHLPAAFATKKAALSLASNLRRTVPIRMGK